VRAHAHTHAGSRCLAELSLASAPRPALHQRSRPAARPLRLTCARARRAARDTRTYTQTVRQTHTRRERDTRAHTQPRHAHARAHSAPQARARTRAQPGTQPTTPRRPRNGRALAHRGGGARPRA
jgi:hypothetical protein